MVGNLYFVLRNLGTGILMMAGSILAAQQSCNNTNPGGNTGDLGCVTFIYQGQPTIYTTVRAADGNIWLQQNLGSERVAESVSDEQAYGDLFQWGRWDDGHQLRNSSLTSAPADNTPNGLQNLNAFITGTPEWWSANGLTDKWTGTGLAEVTETVGADPCKAIGPGWKLPSQADWANIVQAEVIISPAKAFNGNLKLPMGGYRGSDGGFTFAGKRGYFWSSDATGIGGKYLYIGATIANASAGAPRGQGASVRCMKAESVLGTADLNLKKQAVEVFPNPVKGTLTIKTDSVIEKVKIINAVGQDVNVMFSDSQINMSMLAAGLYMIEIQLKNGKTVVKKIMKN